MAGVVAATPNNGVGIAGVGFHSSYMPIKVFRSDNDAFAFGYEAIAYAADRGCQVINLSWGGANAYSQFGEDVINYAVLEKDAVIVAAAGNSGQEERFYPASYDRVLSVAVTDADDQRVAQTTVSHWVDLVAPGNYNYSTRSNDTYSYSSGSSFAAPLVAGAAALVRAHYPRWSAMQVMQQLRLSADDIYGVGTNRTCPEKLGRGRLNAARALQPLNTPALRVESFTYTNHVGPYAFYGDTLDMRMVVKNYLSPATNDVTVTLSSESPYVTVLDAATQVGPIDSLAQATLADNPFRVYLHEDLPANQELVFRIGFSAGSYQDYQYVKMVSSSEYATLDNGSLALSIGSNGDLGYNPTRFEIASGLRKQQQLLASQLGLLLATDAEHVSDNIIQRYASLQRGQDFVRKDRIKFMASPLEARLLRSSFSDMAAFQPLGVTVEQTWLADEDVLNQSFLVGEYRIANPSDQPLTNLRAGLFADWNVGEATQNRAAWDDTHQLGYVYDSEQQTYTGITLLTDQSPIYHAIDRQSFHGNAADTEGEFTDAIKYGFVSRGVGKTEAGGNGSGNDVAHVVGATVPSLAAHAATRVGFALVIGTSLEELQQATRAARQLYRHYRSNPPISRTLPVCPGQSAAVHVPGEAQVRFYQDPEGTLLLAEGASYLTGPILSDTVIYVAPVRDGYEAAISQVAIRITEPIAQFSVDTASNHGFLRDTLFLDESDNYSLRFRDESKHAVAWQWDFGNGFRSTDQHPSVRYTQSGRYTVSLTATSEPGCTHRTTQVITVVVRAHRPILADRTVCPGSTTVLQASNTQRLAVYRDKKLTERLFMGEAYLSEPIEQTTDFFVVNTAETIPSRPQRVRVRTARPAVTIDYQLDTTDLIRKYDLVLKAVGEVSAIRDLAWHIDGKYRGNDLTLVYDFTKALARGNAIDIQLTYVQDSAGHACQQTLFKKINFAAAPVPAFASLRLCQGESATLRPTNGELFYFYRDKQRDSLVHKGRQLVIDSMTMNRTFYVTNMSGLRESEPVAIQVVLNTFADFHMSTDTLYLSESNEAVFEAFLRGAESRTDVSWQWDLGDGQMNYRTSQITQRFDSTGTYQIKLTARTADGCTNTMTRPLVVERVTGLRPRHEDAAFRLYPNPTTGEVFLENRFWFQKNVSLRMYTLAGQLLAQRNLFYDAFPLPLNLRELVAAPLPEGLYLLHIQRGERLFVRKLYLQE